MDTKWFDMGEIEIAWCPGCGNFAILNALKQALSELEIKPEKLVVVSGIGQAAKAPHYYKCNLFNGLHGRSLPVATAIKASNPELIVIDESGDGCMYGEGGNHFIHAIRRNPDITNLVHNNMVYGLTKGQASPTSLRGFKTLVQREGVFHATFSPLVVAISLGASFVARAFAGDVAQTKGIIKKAISHKGYALVLKLSYRIHFDPPAYPSAASTNVVATKAMPTKKGRKFFIFNPPSNFLSLKKVWSSGYFPHYQNEEVYLRSPPPLLGELYEDCRFYNRLNKSLVNKKRAFENYLSIRSL